jgi:hypothetical protein
MIIDPLDRELLLLREMSPLLASELNPLAIIMDPPTLSISSSPVASRVRPFDPETNLIFPPREPSESVEATTCMLLDPSYSEPLDTPVCSDIDPGLFSDKVAPVITAIIPLEPVVPDTAVSRTTLPDNVSRELPLVNNISPPCIDALDPAEMSIRPPFPLASLPSPMYDPA